MLFIFGTAKEKTKIKTKIENVESIFFTVMLLSLNFNPQSTISIFNRREQK
ncbi:hypothetical protein LEP1GSC038_4361 [Leptospira weilii str. 2006001855]|uniref:Uncharacterized protein n=1 Tax=Leptospira weilii str. 2006001855 TaxID=996804 RepID=M6G6U8_9LEPT|nr:hypothetical protein LEP1GSC038_4361 [Leptospira weilii str. 2006001855]